MYANFLKYVFSILINLEWNCYFKTSSVTVLMLMFTYSCCCMMVLKMPLLEDTVWLA